MTDIIQVANLGVQIVEVAKQGIPGRDGVQITFTYTPPTANATWIIVHNLNRYPGIAIVDGSNRVVYADITYLDANTIQASFAFATSGTAYLN